MSRLKQRIRFGLALVAFVVLLSPLATMFSPPDPFTQLIALAVGAVVATPVAVAFVRRSSSLERLYGYVLAIYVLTFVGGIALAGVSFVITAGLRPTDPASGFTRVLVQALFLLVVYALAFRLVYRGGYARLKARFG